MKPLPLLTGLAAAGVLLLSGCAVVEQARDIPGDDPRLLEPGADRTAVEKALGNPLRVWEPNGEVTYGLYNFRATLKGGGIGATLGAASLDIMTLGLMEGMYAADRDQDRDKWHWHSQPRGVVWIGFDRQGRVCGHFREFDILPEHVPAAPVVPGGQP